MSSATTAAEVTSVAPPRERAKVLMPAILFLLLALAPLAVSIGMPAGWLALLTRALIFAIAALSLDLILGVGGLVSFGHAAFLGIGAYVTGIMITLAFGQMVYFLAQALSAYGGDDGLTLYEKSTLLGFNPFASRTSFYYSVLIALAGAYLLVRGLVASRFGRVLRAARENPTRVSVTGFDVNKVRLVAYVISGMLAGLAGFFLANHTEFVSPAFMSWQRSGELIFMAVLGGVGSLHGAIVGAIAYLIAEDALSHVTEHWRAIFGPMIILFVLFTRGGIVGMLRKLGGRHG